ncbi:hypothetical protein OH77DRAFT_1429393 [Trametes cingulata]|nr:hypothetical protein OH77DRAFT_1429393 [Trametes cingulata]
MRGSCSPSTAAVEAELDDLGGVGGSDFHGFKSCASPSDTASNEEPVPERDRNVSIVPVSKSTVLTDPVTGGVRRTSLWSGFLVWRGSQVERLYWLIFGGCLQSGWGVRMSGAQSDPAGYIPSPYRGRVHRVGAYDPGGCRSDELDKRCVDQSRETRASTTDGPAH